MAQKFSIGSRVSGNLDVAGTEGPREVAMRVLGYDGLKAVIVETLEDVGVMQKGRVMLMPTKSLTAREEVKHIPGEPEDENGQAIGWMEMGGLSVALTRAGDGALLISLERAPGYPREHDVTVRIARMNNGDDLWEGDIT